VLEYGDVMCRYAGEDKVLGKVNGSSADRHCQPATYQVSGVRSSGHAVWQFFAVSTSLLGTVVVD